MKKNLLQFYKGFYHSYLDDPKTEVINISIYESLQYEAKISLTH